MRCFVVICGKVGAFWSGLVCVTVVWDNLKEFRKHDYQNSKLLFDTLALIFKSRNFNFGFNSWRNQTHATIYLNRSGEIRLFSTKTPFRLFYIIRKKQLISYWVCAPPLKIWGDLPVTDLTITFKRRYNRFDWTRCKWRRYKTPHVLHKSADFELYLCFGKRRDYMGYLLCKNVTK